MSTLLQRDAKAIDNINRIRFAPATALCDERCWLIDEDGSPHTRSLFVVGRGQPGLWWPGSDPGRCGGGGQSAGRIGVSLCRSIELLSQSGTIDADADADVDVDVDVE
jgi:hypothetical protein